MFLVVHSFREPAMNLRFRSLLSSAIFVFCVWMIPEVHADDSRPNIIVIMVDDMGWSDIGCYGSEIETPNIDRLASEGMLFTQFYNNAKCTTTRASLLTGLYPRNGGRGQHELITRQMLTLGEAMRHVGYATGMSGKWHNGKTEGTRPFDRGFDEAYGLWDGCCNFFNPKIPDPKFKGGRIRPFGHNDRYLQYEDFPPNYYTTDAFTDHAIETVRAHGKSGQPFLHYLAYTAPHYPLHAKPEDIAKYKGKYADGWEVLRRKRLARQKELGLIDKGWTVIDRDDRAKPWDEAKHIDEQWQQLRMEVYAAMIDSVDQNIGRLLGALDDIGASDNTLVLFLTDNGGCAETPGGNDPGQIPGPKEFLLPRGARLGHGLQYAISPLQNSIAMRAESPRRCSHAGPPRSRRDHAARRSAISSISCPRFWTWPAAITPANILPSANPPFRWMEKSLLPVLKGQHRKPHDDLYWNWSTNRAVRQGKWKLVWDKHEKTWELYDLSVDRTEAHDLADEHPELVATLREKWNAWAEKTGVKVKTPTKDRRSLIVHLRRPECVTTLIESVVHPQRHRREK